MDHGHDRANPCNGAIQQMDLADANILLLPDRHSVKTVMKGSLP